MNNKLEDWIANGDADTRSIEDEARFRGFRASCNVIFGEALSDGELLAYIRHCVGVHRGMGRSAAEIARDLVKWEQESRRPMTAAEYQKHEEAKEQ